jgi:hypothetical protein
VRVTGEDDESRCIIRSGKSLPWVELSRSAMSVNKTRGLLYRIARLLGDVNAVQKGTAHKRIVRRAVGRQTGKGLRRLFK